MNETMKPDSINALLTSFAHATDMDACYYTADGRKQLMTCECAGSAFCTAVMGCTKGAERCTASHVSAGVNAMRTGEAYISRCHAGLVIIAAPIMRGETYAGCICCQPAMMWDWDEVAVQEILQRTGDLPVPPETLLASSRDICVLSAKKIRAQSVLLYALAAQISGGENQKLVEQRQRSQQQMHLADVVIERKREDDTLLQEGERMASYPLQMERELLGKVRLGDRAGARGILNDLLGHILFRAAGNLDVMKARILELVVMISRAAVESGAELEKLLGLNYNFIAELSGLDTYEDICLWVVKVLDAFMDTVYASRNIRNSRFLGEALTFIRSRYMHNLTLDEVAQSVHISPFYLSHLFKEELGITFVEYLTRVRIEEARRLLVQTGLSMAQIASAVGYEDASYFSKVFKKVTGSTPNRYRKGS